NGQEDRIEALEVGAEREGVVYVRRVEDGAILVVPREAAEALSPSEIALRPKKIFDEPAASFRMIRVSGPRGVQRAERRADGAWVLVEPHGEGLSLDPGLLSELADSVAGLAVERWVGAARPEHGLDRPRIAIEAETVGGKKLEVSIGAPSRSGSFARASVDQ